MVISYALVKYTCPPVSVWGTVIVLSFRKNSLDVYADFPGITFFEENPIISYKNNEYSSITHALIITHQIRLSSFS